MCSRTHFLQSIVLLFPLLLRNKSQNLQVTITVSEKQTKKVILDISEKHDIEKNTLQSLRLTSGPQTSGWGWYIVGYCTWPHIRIAWRVQSYPPRRVGYRKHSHLACAVCRALGCTSTMAYCPPLRSVCVCLHTSRDSCPWQHQLMKKARENPQITSHTINDLYAIRGTSTLTYFFMWPIPPSPYFKHDPSDDT